MFSAAITQSQFRCTHSGVGMNEDLSALLLKLLCSQTVPDSRIQAPASAEIHRACASAQRALGVAHPVEGQSSTAAGSAGQENLCEACGVTASRLLCESGQRAPKPRVSNRRKNPVLKGQSTDTL